MYWNDVPAGLTSESLLRLLTRLGDKADLVLKRLFVDDQYLDEAASFLISPTKKPDPPTEFSEDPWIGIEEIAKFLLIPVSTAYRYANSGTIVGSRAGRHWRFRRQEVLAYLPRNY